MATYFQAKNNKGVVTIDDKTKRLCFSRAVQANNIISNPSWHEIGRPGGSNPPGDTYAVREIFSFDVYFQPGEIYCSIWIPEYFSNINGYSVWMLPINNGIRVYAAVTYSSAGQTVSGYSFNAKLLALNLFLIFYGTETQKLSDNCGLIIFNENGEEIFNSSYKPLDIIGEYRAKPYLSAYNLSSAPKLLDLNIEGEYVAFHMSSCYGQPGGWWQDESYAGSYPFTAIGFSYGICRKGNRYYAQFMCWPAFVGSFPYTYFLDMTITDRGYTFSDFSRI